MRLPSTAQGASTRARCLCYLYTSLYRSELVVRCWILNFTIENPRIPSIDPHVCMYVCMYVMFKLSTHRDYNIGLCVVDGSRHARLLQSRRIEPVRLGNTDLHAIRRLATKIYRFAISISNMDIMRAGLRSIKNTRDQYQDQ